MNPPNILVAEATVRLLMLVTWRVKFTPLEAAVRMMYKQRAVSYFDWESVVEDRPLWGNQ